MTIDQTPTVRVYVRERGGKRNFHPAPRNPDSAACYWLRYEKNGKQTWQRVGDYDLVAREKLLLERRLSAQAQGSADRAQCESKERMLDRIKRDVRIEGPLTAEQRSRLLEIANKCPVHRTLTSEINIRTRLL